MVNTQFITVEFKNIKCLLRFEYSNILHLKIKLRSNGFNFLK